MAEYCKMHGLNALTLTHRQENSYVLGLGRTVTLGCFFSSLYLLNGQTQVALSGARMQTWCCEKCLIWGKHCVYVDLG